MSHSWQETDTGWTCFHCGKTSSERVPDYKGCMSPGLLQKPEKGPRHIWMIVNEDGKFWWKCCECDKTSYEDLPPPKGCKKGKP